MGLRKPKDADGTKEGGTGSLWALFKRLRTQREPLEVVSLEHEEYEGRNVLDITLWDEYDGLDEVTHYDQPIFRRGHSPPE